MCIRARIWCQFLGFLMIGTVLVPIKNVYKDV
ncbi:MAG: hypothetical protein RI914_603, partial [Pseudomonadota bacterium]